MTADLAMMDYDQSEAVDVLFTIINSGTAVRECVIGWVKPVPAYGTMLKNLGESLKDQDMYISPLTLISSAGATLNPLDSKVKAALISRPAVVLGDKNCDSRVVSYSL